MHINPLHLITEMKQPRMHAAVENMVTEFHYYTADQLRIDPAFENDVVIGEFLNTFLETLEQIIRHGNGGDNDPILNAAHFVSYLAEALSDINQQMHPALIDQKKDQ